MGGDEVFRIRSAHVLLTPQVTDALQTLDTHLAEILAEIHTGIGCTHIEDSNRMAAVTQGTTPYLDVAIQHHTLCLFA